MARMWLNVDIEVEVENPDNPNLSDKGFVLHILHLLVKDQILDFGFQLDKLDIGDESVVDYIRLERDKADNPDKYTK
jgi:hypothetical protein